MKTLMNCLRTALLALILTAFCFGLMLPAWAHGDHGSDRGDHGRRSGDSSQTSDSFDDGDSHSSRDKKPKPDPTPKPGPRDGGADD